MVGSRMFSSAELLIEHSRTSPANRRACISHIHARVILIAFTSDHWNNTIKEANLTFGGPIEIILEKVKVHIILRFYKSSTILQLSDLHDSKKSTRLVEIFGVNLRLFSRSTFVLIELLAPYSVLYRVRYSGKVTYRNRTSAPLLVPFDISNERGK